MCPSFYINANAMVVCWSLKCPLISGKSNAIMMTVVHLPNVDQCGESPAQLMERLLASYAVPEEKQMQLFTYLRLASNFSNYGKRLKCVMARLQVCFTPY